MLFNQLTIQQIARMFVERLVFPTQDINVGRRRDGFHRCGLSAVVVPYKKTSRAVRLFGVRKARVRLIEIDFVAGSAHMVSRGMPVPIQFVLRKLW